MMTRSAAVVLPSMLGFMFGVSLVVASGSARAQGLVVPKKNKGESDAPAVPLENNWMDYNARPLTLGKGVVGIHADFAVDISANQWGKPLWLIPNVYYGVSDQLSVGIVENPTWEFFPSQGGFCLSNSTYCGKVVVPNNTSLDLKFSLNRTASMEVAFHGGIDLLAIDPFTAAGRAGLLLKILINGPVSIMADPSFRAGITRRAQGNTEYLSVPIRVGYQLNPQVNVGLLTGVNSALDGFADRYQVPVGLTGLAALTDKIDVGATLLFPAVAGFVGPGASHADYRSFAMSASYRM
jgi:hypothetical protein